MESRLQGCRRRVRYVRGPFCSCLFVCMFCRCVRVCVFVSSVGEGDHCACELEGVRSRGREVINI